MPSWSSWSSSGGRLRGTKQRGDGRTREECANLSNRMTPRRLRVPHHLQAECFYHTLPAQISAPVLRGSRNHHAVDLPIIPDSLKATLEAHRYANRQRLIRRVPFGPSTHPDGMGPFKSEQGKQRQKSWPVQNLVTTESPAPTSSELGLELLTSSTKKRRLDIRPNGAVSLFRRLAKKGSAGLTTQKQAIQCPWLDYLETSGHDGISRMDDEIKAFEAYISPVPQEETAVENLVSELADLLQRADHPQPLLIGSRQTGLALRHSNIDLLIPLPDPDGSFESRGPSPTRPKVAELQLERQAQISRLLRGTAIFNSVTLIRSRIPIVTAVHAATSLRLTLHCGTQFPTSLEFIQSYQSEFPTLRPLLAILRMVLEQRSLFGPQNQGINNYTLTMMIVAALKLSEGKYPRTNTAAQLLHILRFFSTINFRRYGIAVEPPAIFHKRGHRKSFDRMQADAPSVRGQISIGKVSAKLAKHMLCLQDPANYMNDLGMECFRTLEIQRVFGYVYADLRAAIKAWDGEWEGTAEETTGGKRKEDLNLMTARLIRDSEDKKGVSMLQLALGGDYERLETMRDRIILGGGS
ncbi:predicted protein [Uncinocarpus reesii 1704]|uniref:Polynucleotide adenylyltransferase n=1 Tax=Uncinocarpus reesii (strain UAMH 1704) TaxID=336963 RepID=C4JWJ5_UNCRE|nr:uncharacterized protein UREG_06937 [Uncinocarpus reesii 1704]EEP82072.1 predicted protein [Uncinocarpus reesii 1704]